MSRKYEPKIWPFVVVLAALFALTAAAPRQWQQRLPRRREAVAAVASHGIAPRAIAGSFVSRGSPLPQQDGLSTPSTNERDAVGRDELAVSSSVSSSVSAAPSAASVARQQVDAPPAEDQPLGSSLQFAIADAQIAQPPHDGEPSSARNSLASGPAGDEESNPALVAEPMNEPAAAPTFVAVQPRTAVQSRPAKSFRGGRRPRTATVARRKPATAWGEPSVLLDQLDRLSGECDAGEWAVYVADRVRELCRIENQHSPSAALTLKRLRDLVDANHPLLTSGEQTPKKGELRRLRYAVLRRLDLWDLTPDLADGFSDAETDDGRTVSLAGSSRSARQSARSHVAKLLEDLERFELTGLGDDGHDLAADVSRLASRDEKLTAKIRRWLEWNYRNSNLRIVLSKELLNRLVPPQPAVEQPVHDRILGVPTRGWSSSTARVSIRLMPDPRSVNFSLEAKGIVFARTVSRREPVTLYSNSDSAYLAHKRCQLTAGGLQTWPAVAEVSNSSHLRGIETDFDDVPILGPVVEGIARAKHAESEPAVRRVARRKVATRVQEEIDSTIEPKLVQARQLYRERVLSPLEGLSLTPAVIELQTSEARLTSRLRLAGDEQVAASTPRPMALSDSLASVQIHQSLVNNICDRLNLDGQEFTLPQLQKRIVETFQLPPAALSEEYPADLRITFAKRDAIAVRFDDGRIELTLGVAELHKYPKTWRDFQVRVFYRPRLNGLDLRFVRDGTVQLRGDRFGRDPQIALRGIFSKVFSHDRELIFFDQQLLDDPRLAGLSVTQCVLTDGWIGLSLGSGPLRQARITVGPLY